MNKVLNRPMFRKEALRKGHLKPIKANIGTLVGQPYSPPGVPALSPGQGVFSPVNTQRFGPPKPTRMQNIMRNPLVNNPVTKGLGRMIGLIPYEVGTQTYNYLGRNPNLSTGEKVATSGLAALGSSFIPGAIKYGRNPYVLGAYTLGFGGKAAADYGMAKRREAGKPLIDRAAMVEDYLPSDTTDKELFGTPKKPSDTRSSRPTGRVRGGKNTQQLRSEGDVLMSEQVEGSEPGVADLNKIELASLPMPGGRDISKIPSSPVTEEKEDKKKAVVDEDTAGSFDPQSGKINAADGTPVTNSVIQRARQIAEELKEGRSSQANLVFLANLASGLLSGTTQKGGIGGAMEVFGRAIGPAVNNYATIKLKESELDNELFTSALELASDEMDRKNQAYEYPDSDPGVVQIIDENGKTINFTGTRLKDGTVMAAIPGVVDNNGRYIYRPLPPGSYVKFQTNDTLAKPQLDLLRELDGKYRAYALGQKSIKILEDMKERGVTGAGPLGRFNLFTQRLGSAFEDIMGRKMFDDEKSAEARLKEERDKMVSELMVSEELSEKEANKKINEILGDSIIKEKIMEKIKEATGEDDKQKLSQLAINETVMVYALANSLKSKDRLTQKDIEMASRLVNIFPLLRGQSDVIRDLRSVNTTILGDIESLQNNYIQSLMGETATINQYRRKYGLAEGPLDQAPTELGNLFKNKTDEDIAGDIQLGN